MKTFAIAFVTVVIVSGMLVSLGAMSGYLDFNIEFGSKDDIVATQTSNSPDIVIIADNNEPDTETKVQVPPPKSIFWYQTPFKTIFWEPEFAEMPPIESAEIDWDNLSIYDPPEFYIPDPPTTVPNPDQPEVIENPNLPEAIENPDQPEAIENLNPPEAIDHTIKSGTGEVQYMDFEGGFYGIISDDGEHYDPVNLASEFMKDNLKISFKVKILDSVSIHIWGRIVEILEIEKI